jgi:hypothetical protein
MFPNTPPPLDAVDTPSPRASAINWRRLAVGAILTATHLFHPSARAADPVSGVLEAEIRYSGKPTGTTEVVTMRPSPSLSTNILKVLEEDPRSLSAVSTLLFQGSPEEMLAARRELRLAWAPPPLPPPEVESATFNPIDQFIASKWKTAGLASAQQPPDLCSDPAFLRRIFLDLVGVIPTAGEVTEFLKDDSPTKRSALVEKLLNRRGDYAAHWATFWMEMLGGEGVLQPGRIAAGPPLQDWILSSLSRNQAYDLMVSQLIDPTLPGSPPGRPGSDSRSDAIHDAAWVARTFLGANVSCAACHDDREQPDWPQVRLLAFAGMFAETNIDFQIAGQNQASPVPAAFPIEIPGAPTSVPRGLEARVRRVAQLLVDPANPRFSRTLVNRLWKRFFGLALVEPSDDFQSGAPSRHPELLAWLADDFARHGFDLQRLIGLIVSSRTYQLQYDARLADSFDPENPALPRFYQSPSLRRLSAEQLLDSILVAANQRLETTQRAYRTVVSTPLRRALGAPAWRAPANAFRPPGTGLALPLELLNGSEFWQVILDSTLVKDLAAQPDPARGVDQLFQAALSRPPTPEELQASATFVSRSLSGETRPDASQMEVWFDDAPPPGATLSGSAGIESWTWGSPPTFPVLSGSKAHGQGGGGIQRQHYFSEASPPLPIGPEDILVVHVFIAQDDPPREIMMQWNDGSWDHRAFWGEDLIRLGQKDSPGRRAMGALPKSGQWVALEVPVRDVGIGGGNTLSGWSFDQLGGTVHWDKAGVIRVRAIPPEEPLRDLLWTLLASPEFQFIY